jgi:predicted site-specific integrase-resolvase
MGELVSLDEAGTFLQVHRVTVWRLVRDGRLSEHWLPGRRLGVDMDEVRARMRPV